MYKIGKMPQAVDIGYVGETRFRKLEIDMKDWMRLMPEGVPSIVCIRPGETKADAYVAVTTFEDDVLTWVITAADIGTQEGEGEIQIWLEEEENSSVIKRGKSVKVKTRVNDSANDPSPDTPTSQEAFIEQVTGLKTATVNAKNAAETAQTAAETAASHYPYIDDTTGTWMVWDTDTSAYVDTEINAQGPAGATGAKGDKGDKGDTGAKGDKGDTGEKGAKGDKGDKGDTGATGSTGPQGPKGDTGDTGATGATGPKGDKGDTGAQGPQGEPGDPTELIDDTDPALDKTFSSSKIDSELTDVKNAIQGNSVEGKDTLQYLTYGFFGWFEMGSINESTGENETDSKKVRSDYISLDSFVSCDIEKLTGYGVHVFLYTSNKTYITTSPTTWEVLFYSKAFFTVNYPTAKYIRFVFRKNNGNTAVPKDVSYSINISTLGNTIKEVAYSFNYTNIIDGSISSYGADSTGSTRCRTAEYISMDEFVRLDMTKHTTYDIYAFVYGSDKSFLARFMSNWQSFSFNRAEVLEMYPTAKYIRFTWRRNDNGTVTSSDRETLKSTVFITPSYVQKEEAERIKARFDKQFNFVAYSGLSDANDASINTAEHFLYCAKSKAFTALKGDVRPTSDGGLIMCHDAGYTFDSNNRIISYDASDSTAISTLTTAQCKALEFARQHGGQYIHPTDFETFVKICKEYGLICYVTVRDEQIADVVAPEVMRILKKYRMLEHCIINSQTKATLEVFRTLHRTVMLSFVKSHNSAMTQEDVDYVLSLGNCILNLFDIPVPSGENLNTILTSYATYLTYAQSKNVIVYEAQSTNDDTDIMIQHGIMGTHIREIPDLYS